MSTTINQEENIIQLDFSEEMKTSYRDYAMSVIIARALPDVRDGLKPVQRRILYACKELGLAPDKPHRKSARIVGDTMGKYHPHGDSSIYDALVHMAQEYSLAIPLIDGHGNFGSIDGDSAAAMRYTEARLSKGGALLLENLDKNLVDFIPNFDNSEKEPVVLPAMLPNLLINGTTGIAVGMATNIPTHNPAEVIDGVIATIDSPNITMEKLMSIIPGPDFPTGGIIVNKSDLMQIYSTGEGRIRIRGRVETEKGEYGRTNLIITEIPYTLSGNKTKLVESFTQLMRDKVFDEIYDVRDESSKEGIRIVIEVKKDRDAENLLNGLYKKTPLEDTYSVNLLAVKEQQPITFNLKSMILEFIDFQKELYTKEFTHLLNKSISRLEIVDGLIRATDVIDLIIEILRGSQSVKQAKECLTTGNITDIKFKSKESEKQAKTLDFTPAQADAILAMPLSRLVGLEILKLTTESDELKGKIEEYKEILSNEKSLLKQIKNRLRAYKKEFDEPRKTQISDEETVNYKEEVKIETVYVLVDKFGYTKSVDTATYSRTTPESLAEYKHIVCLNNDDKLCVFSAQGNMYQVKVSSIPKTKIKDKGVLMHNLCKLGDEDIIAVTSFETLFESQTVFITKKGYIKRVSGAEFMTNRLMIASTKLEENDEISSITLLTSSQVLSGDMKVIIYTDKKLSLGFMLEDVPEFKKTGRGVKAISLDSKDSIAFSTVLSIDEDIFVFDGQKYSAKRVRTRSRGAKGQKASL